jgi:hypothetical protein
MVAKNGTALPIRRCISRIHTTLEPKGRERRDGQARQPLPAICGFPAPGCRGAVAAFHRQRETMYTAFGTPVWGARWRTLWQPCSQSHLKIRRLFSQNPMSVGALKGDYTLSRIQSSAYTTDIQLSRVTRIPEYLNILAGILHSLAMRL